MKFSLDQLNIFLSVEYQQWIVKNTLRFVQFFFPISYKHQLLRRSIYTSTPSSANPTNIPLPASQYIKHLTSTRRHRASSNTSEENMAFLFIYLYLQKSHHSSSSIHSVEISEQAFTDDYSRRAAAISRYLKGSACRALALVVANFTDVSLGWTRSRPGFRLPICSLPIGI